MMKSFNDLHVNASLFSVIKCGGTITPFSDDMVRIRRASYRKEIIVERPLHGIRHRKKKRFPLSIAGLELAIDFALGRGE